MACYGCINPNNACPECRANWAREEEKLKEHRTKIHKAEEIHEELRLKFVAVIGEYADKLSAEEMLAIASILVGQLLAMQDQTKWTVEQLMVIVSANIEQGNKEAIESSIGQPSMGRA